ncbi:response regulator [Pedosphaera parvula]|uniref:Response regulator receiver protein n=1 Tax=Pedosphaera parvula (strain Ellin514) TaxID=320771 RepID=B9XM65_PEDPL|nr:response regulator [Pedosphaera parvula]EEF59058.1 response regulator receiver protein [Pedosphaera parvula Ellin514]
MRKLTVIIADDDDEDREFLRLALGANENFELINELKNGAEALHYVSGAGAYHNRVFHPLPDLLIIDAVMPSFHVREILAYLALYPAEKMKIVIVTGVPDTQLRAECLRLGANAFYYKPAELEQLLAMIKEIETNLLEGRYG